MAKSQIGVLITLLFELLRARGLRYHDIATKLDVTERTVTRWFSSDCVSTRVIEQLCGLAGVTFFDLCELAAKKVEKRASQLTHQQEQALADDALMSYLFTQILKGWAADEIRREVEIPEAVFVDALIRLEKLNLIELLPGNEIRLRTLRDIEWLPNGPYSRSMNKWLTWILDRPEVTDPDEIWAADAMKLSAASFAQLQLKFRSLMEEAQELCAIDRRVNFHAREWYALALATRPLEMRPFSDWSTPYRHPRKGRKADKPPAPAG